MVTSCSNRVQPCAQDADVYTINQSHSDFLFTGTHLCVYVMSVSVHVHLVVSNLLLMLVHFPPPQPRPSTFPSPQRSLVLHFYTHTQLLLAALLTLFFSLCIDFVFVCHIAGWAVCVSLLLFTAPGLNLSLIHI